MKPQSQKTLFRLSLITYTLTMLAMYFISEILFRCETLPLGTCF